MPDTKLASALLAARKVMKDPRLDGTNPHFGSRFVPRDAAIDAIVPAMLTAGVFLTQGVRVKDGACVLVTTAHMGDEWLELCEYPLTANADPQKFLAQCTYASRGSMMLVAMLAGDEDDDGNTAAKKEPESAADPLAEAKAELKTLSALAEKNGTKEEYAIQLGRPKTLADAAKWFVKYTPEQKEAVRKAARGELS